MAESVRRRRRRESRVIISDIQRAAQAEVNRQIDQISENICTVGRHHTGVTYDDIIRTPFPFNDNQDRTAQLTRDVIDNARFRLAMDWGTSGDYVNVTNIGPPEPHCHANINDHLCCDECCRLPFDPH